MLRVAIIIFCAGITVPVSALAFQGPKAPSNSFVELEFGKSYTIESLAALREEQWAPHSKNSSSIITEAAANFENNPGLTSRRDTSVTQDFSIGTMWKCTAAPTIDRTMKMKITSTGGPLINDPDQYSAYVTFAGVSNIESFDKRTTPTLYTAPTGNAEYTNTAYHGFCLKIDNQICSYRLSQVFRGTLEVSGLTNPQFGIETTLTEGCVPVPSSGTVSCGLNQSTYCSLKLVAG